MRIVLGLALLLNLGCDGSALCSSCQKMEGTYALTAGHPAIESPDCASVPASPVPASVTITRQGAELRATIYGIKGRGVQLDTADFSISGAEEPDGGAKAGTASFTLRGLFRAGMSSADAGMITPASLEGTWVTHAERGDKICDAQQSYLGIKQ